MLSLLVIDQKFARWYEFQGDTAMYYQSLQSIDRSGVPLSNIGASSVWIHTYQPARLTPAQLAVAPLPPSPISELNLLEWHSYFILYPIAALTLIFPAPPILVGIYVLSFTGALLFAYLLIRSRGVPVAAALVYCVLLMTYIPWSQGLTGQFYPDRIFVLAGLGFMYVVSVRRSPVWLQIALGLACASITERGALVAGIAAIAFAASSWRALEQRRFRLGLGIALLAISFAEFHSLINTENGHYMAASLRQLARWFSNPVFAGETVSFVVVNLPLLLLALFDRRRAAVALLLMLPNVFGSINGNEKIGWTTSYHSYYMPALILASASGFALAYERARTAMHRNAVLAATAALALFTAMLDPYAFPRIDVSFGNIGSSFIPQLVPAVKTVGSQPGYAADYAAIRKAVPRGSLVTAVEPAMPILYRDRNLQFYPLGLDRAGYAVLSPATEPDGTHNLFGGFATFANEQKRADAALLARMRKDGYDVDHPLVFDSVGLVVVKHSKMMLRDL